MQYKKLTEIQKNDVSRLSRLAIAFAQSIEAGVKSRMKM